MPEWSDSEQADSKQKETNPFCHEPLVIGHRGAAGLFPENTLPGFEQAVALGVAAVEFDVRACDGELLVIHDDKLDRTTNGSGPIAGRSLNELRALDAGDGARIPFLGEILDCLPHTIGINVELKGRGGEAQRTAELLAAHLAGSPSHPVLVSSFNHKALRRFADQAPEIPCAPLFARWQKNALKVADEFRSGFINLGRPLVTERRMQDILKKDLRVLVYTVNDLEDARWLLAAGVSGVFTDRPDLITAASLAAHPAD